VSLFNGHLTRLSPLNVGGVGGCKRPLKVALTPQSSGVNPQITRSTIDLTGSPAGVSKASSEAITTLQVKLELASSEAML